MAGGQKNKPTGYDKYVNWKLFAIPVILFFLILLLPTLSGMKDVGTEYSLGPKYVVAHIINTLFNKTLPMPISGNCSLPVSWNRTCRWGPWAKRGF